MAERDPRADVIRQLEEMSESLPPVQERLRAEQQRERLEPKPTGQRDSEGFLSRCMRKVRGLPDSAKVMLMMADGSVGMVTVPLPLRHTIRASPSGRIFEHSFANVYVERKVPDEE